MTLTKFGLKEWGSALLITAVIEFLCFWFLRGHYLAYVIGIAALLIFAAVAAFFRNPRRVIPSDPNGLISPADGTVKDIEIVKDFDFPPFTGEAIRIGIFLSVLNVHVNRASAEIKVLTTNYRPGEFLDARHPECGKRNEAMTIIGEGRIGVFTFPMAIRQISGAIARRIVCPVQPGSTLKKGEVYGMIKFGSRTELYLPPEQFEVAVKIGERVRGGSTIIARKK